MATKTATKPHVTNYVSDLFDVVKGSADDLLDSVKTLEKSARTRSKELRDAALPSEKDIKRLRKQTVKLTDEVERITKIKGSKKSSK